MRLLTYLLSPPTLNITQTYGNHLDPALFEGLGGLGRKPQNQNPKANQTTYATRNKTLRQIEPNTKPCETKRHSWQTLQHIETILKPQSKTKRLLNTVAKRNYSQTPRLLETVLQPQSQLKLLFNPQQHRNDCLGF